MIIGRIEADDDRVRIIADRSADILNALELAREFDLNIVIEGGAEAHLVADELQVAFLIAIPQIVLFLPNMME